MNKSELKALIRESVEEVMKEFAPLGVAEERLDEKSPPGVPRDVYKKTIEKHGNEKGHAMLWKAFYAKEAGHKKMNEMWTAWENKSLNEAEEADHDETDLTNPEEKKEVEIANKIHELVMRLLEIHGVSPHGEESAESSEKETETEEEPQLAEEETEQSGEENLEDPSENEEVKIATEIRNLANELLAMHGVEDAEEASDEEGEEGGDVEQLTEKWNVKDAVHPSRKGMFKGKTKADLEKQLSNLKKKGPHKRGSKEDIKMKELNFAIRAKSGWKKKKK